jgi:hypothetical protein
MNIDLQARRVLLLALSVGAISGMMSLPARAELPFTAYALATVQATLDHCIEIDNERADSYRKFGTAFTQGVSAGDVRGVKNTDAYKDAYTAARERLAKQDVAEAISACHEVAPVAAQ